MHELFGKYKLTFIDFIKIPTKTHGMLKLPKVDLEYLKHETIVIGKFEPIKYTLNRHHVYELIFSFCD